MLTLPILLHKHGLASLVGTCLALLPLAAPAQPPPVADPPVPTPAPGVNPAAFPSPHGPPGSDWMAHFQRSADRSKRGNVDLIFDGDSITDFWMGAGKEVWEKNYGRLNAVDYGISGDRTEHLLWRLEHGQVANLHPRLVVVMIGTNNTGANTDAQIAEGVTAVVRAYQKLCPTAVILLQAIFPRAESPTDSTRQQITRINRLLPRLGDGNKVVYLDFGSRFVLPNGTINRDLLPDTLHPGTKGYEVWAAAIRPTVEKIFGPTLTVR